MHIQRVRAAAGLCPYCGKEPVSGRKLCQEHLDASARRASKYLRSEKGQEVRSIRRRGIHRELSALKAARGCRECGEKHPACLDFHHRDPEQKSFSLGNATRRGRGEMLAELEKCDVLCANCHRVMHWNMRREHGTTGEQTEA